MTKRRFTSILAIALAALTFGACNVVVSNDGTAYTYANPSAGAVVVTAPATSGGNEREFFWDYGTPTEVDSTVCATFASGQNDDQQGILLRANWSSSTTTGITVTRNIWMGFFDVFNFHYWNTGADPSAPFTQFGSVIVDNLAITPAAYPLNVCARTIAGQLEFVEWTPDQAQPQWGDSGQGGEAEIPAGAPASGQGGLFAGHMTPGTTMSYTALTVDGSVDADPIAN